VAAQQAGVSKRLFIVDMQDEVDGHGPLVVINPKFVVTEGERDGLEGCLCIPGMIGDVDTLIAATAIENDLTLVTTDSDFERVPELRLVRLDRAALR